MLTFDVDEIVMPVVPLGVTSKATFRINNQGYDNLELGYSLPPDKTRVPISIAFPEGTTLGMRCVL